MIAFWPCIEWKPLERDAPDAVGKRAPAGPPETSRGNPQ